MDIYLLDSNLNRIHVIDDYESLIWAERYNELGDCELVLSATSEHIDLLNDSKYISCDDSDMVCKIEKIEIATDAENGNQLIITGYDVKKMVNQRVVAKQINFNGTVEDYIRRMVTDNIINPVNVARKIPNFVLGTKANFTEVIEQQITWDNLGKKIQELCKTYGWGYKVEVVNNYFVFKLYAGSDRSEYVIFSPEYENISTTDYVSDKSNLKNTVMIAGEGEGVDRVVAEITDGSTGVYRDELYVDASDISKTIDYGELTRSYPDGIEVTIGGVTYYQVNGVNIAILTITSTSITAKLTDAIYEKSLLSKGDEELAEYVEQISFEGSIEPSRTFKYKEDYWLGDIVTILNEYGIESEVRISEIIQVHDDNGYSLEVKFEYISLSTDDAPYLLAETNERLMTENFDFLTLESSNEVSQLSTTNDTFGSKRISELPPSTDIYDGCCMPVVTNGETKKLTYALLKERLAEDIGGGGIPEGGTVGDMLVKAEVDTEWEHKNALTNSEIEDLINAMA